MPTITTTLRPHECLKRPEDFKAVYDNRRSVADESVIVYGRPNGLDHCRLGMSVSKKKYRRAVHRNRVRRLFREAYRLSKPDLPTGVDLIVLPRRGGDEFTLAGRRESLTTLVAKLHRRLTREGEPE